MSHPDILDERIQRKVVEVATFFLLRARDLKVPLTHFHLLHWLYLAERQSLKKYGELMMGAAMLSWEQGPGLASHLGFQEESKHPHYPWKNIMLSRNNQWVLHPKSPYQSSDDLLQLSEADVDLLNEIWESILVSKGEVNPHQYPEWCYDPNQANPIELKTLLLILGFTPTEGRHIIEHDKAIKTWNLAFK